MIGNKPNVKRGEWIAIGNTDCVVCEIYDESDSYEVEVVTSYIRTNYRIWTYSRKWTTYTSDLDR